LLRCDFLLLSAATYKLKSKKKTKRYTHHQYLNSRGKVLLTSLLSLASF
jgi:hypothetical protein